MNADALVEGFAARLGLMPTAERRDGVRLFIAGGQLTGKSTVARTLAAREGLRLLSAGTIVREMAERSSLSVEQMSERLGAAPETEVELDRGLARVAAQGPTVVESRLAGWLGAAVRIVEAIPATTILLRCDEDERARRWASRELGLHLPKDWRSDRSAVRRVDLRAAMMEAVAAVPPQLRPSLDVVAASAARDERDRSRLQELYGIDYDDPMVFDAVLDVTVLSPTEVADAIMAVAASTG